MGFLLFIVIVFGGMSYGIYYLIDFFFPNLFSFLLSFVGENFIPTTATVIIFFLVIILSEAGLRSNKSEES